MGNFQLLGSRVSQLQSASLIGLKGLVGVQHHIFMLDSGASSNFISGSLVRNLGLRYQSEESHNVRLANGKMLQTLGQVQMRVQFGGFVYVGRFHVLEGQVPLILGMEFLVKAQPMVDWKGKSVSCLVGNKRFDLPTCEIGGSANQEDSSAHRLDNNSFKGLDVSLDIDADVAVTADIAQQENVLQTTPRAENCRGTKRQKQCCQCGKVFVGKEAFCQNCSDDIIQKFAEHDHSVQDHVKSKDVEVVGWKCFAKRGKQQQYKYVGLLQFESDLCCADVSPDDVACNNVIGQFEQLNFTHRSTLGGGDDADQDVGRLGYLAKSQMQKLKQKYSSVFEDPVYPVDRSDCPQVFEHQIPMLDDTAPPPKRKLYPLDSTELAELKKQLQTFIDDGRIEVANGPYGAPILFAKKKDGGLRMCIDYRALNGQTCSDVYPLPRPDELLQRLNGAKVFSKIDMRDGYHQVPMRESDRVKTSFSCRYGTYQFTVMPFGLSNAPATFQRMMNNIFFDLLDQGVLVYLDDVLIYSKSVEEHCLLLDKVFSLLQLNKLYLKEKKCSLFLEKINFLGHVVSSEGVSLESGKVQVVQQWPTPQTVTHVQQFLGLCNYYRRFIVRFSEVASPLTLLTRKDQKFVWGSEQQRSFDLLKSLLSSAPVLKVFDSSLDTRLVCDASNFCIGGVLEQKQPGGNWHPVEFYSKRLSMSERNYSATDREYVAIRTCLERWRHFLVGIKFVILTDHVALTYIQTSASVSRRNARWLEFLSQFDFTIEHIKGKENVVADTLSRIPGSESVDCMKLCNLYFTCGLQHVDDLGDLADPGQQLRGVDCLSGVLTIQESKSFLKQLKQEQFECRNEWYLQKVKLAQEGSLQFQFRNGLLCKLVGDHFCPVIPDKHSSSVQVVLHDMHSSSLGGHLGFRKLLKLAQSRFYWQGMHQSVGDFVKSCEVCQANKHSTQQPTGLLQPVENPERPFEVVTMDFITHLPVSTRGYDAVFSIVDRFSRLCRFIPCKTSMSALECAHLFFEHWVCRFGMPQKIISDRDVRFTSQFWQQLFRLLQCRVALSTAYHPQTDGLTERFHRSVEQVLRCYCSGVQDQWCTLLPQCEFALNSTFQDAVQSVPFQVVHGFQPVLPIDVQLDSVQLPAVHDFVAARNSIQSQVKASLLDAQQRMQRLANRHRREINLEVGQQVWLATKHLPLKVGTRKLAAIWAGPYTILDRVGPVAFRLQLPEDWGVHNVFHISQLKPLVGDVELEQSIEVESGEEFEIERVLASRVVKNVQQYLVKWKGYSDFENMWLPVSELGNAQQAIADFEKTLPGKSRSRRGSGVRT